MISETRTGNHSNFIQKFCPIRYTSNVLKMKRSWYLFPSTLGLQPNILTLSTLVSLLLQKFEFTFLFKFSCVSREWSSDFNPPSYLQPWIGSVHQSYIVGASLGEELVGISFLGGGDFILRALIAFKICHMDGLWSLKLYIS